MYYSILTIMSAYYQSFYPCFHKDFRIIRLKIFKFKTNWEHINHILVTTFLNNSLLCIIIYLN